MIPSGTRFIGFSESVNLKEKKSAVLNSETQPYTIDDIRGYKVYTALLTQSGDGTETILYNNSILDIGTSYTFASSYAGDDFSNVGGPLVTVNGEFDGDSFDATGTTPNSWTNGTQLSYGSGTPVATVLENTIGEVIWTRTGIGDYLASNILFSASNTIGFVGGHNGSNNMIFDASGTIEEAILWQYDPVLAQNVDGFDCQIEIRVYN